MLGEEWEEHEQFLIDTLKKHGYTEEEIKQAIKEIAAETAKPRRYGKPRTEEERAIRHRSLYGTEPPPRGTGVANKPEVLEEEFKTPLDQLIAKEAAKIYKMTTGKKPPKKMPQEFYVKAMYNILKRWQKTLKETYEAMTAFLGRPRESPFERTRKELEEHKPVVTKCPRCGGETLKMIGPGVWVCKKCGYWISVRKWFKRK